MHGHDTVDDTATRRCRHTLDETAAACATSYADTRDDAALRPSQALDDGRVDATPRPAREMRDEAPFQSSAGWSRQLHCRSRRAAAAIFDVYASMMATTLLHARCFLGEG